MSKNRLPKIRDPLADITNLSINPNIIPDKEIDLPTIVNVEPEEPVSSKSVFGKLPKKEKDGISLDIIVNEGPELPVEPIQKKTVGERGRDKKLRKKRIVTAGQLEALARGRANSLAKRKANKERKEKLKTEKKIIPVIAKPTPAQQLDYSTFSNYMDMYEEKKQKKRSTTTQPHPNKVINERHRPTPPQSAPRVVARPKKALNWTGNITAYQTHKKSHSSRWNYGI
tara:strand:+ start:2063 stop:2743 length:681 start_codon:yes stop_codon:yes gene_type:complete